MLLGVALCFLGFMNNGFVAGHYVLTESLDLQDTSRASPLSRLVTAEWALPLVTLVWTLAWLGHFVRLPSMI